MNQENKYFICFCFSFMEMKDQNDLLLYNQNKYRINLFKKAI